MAPWEAPKIVDGSMFADGPAKLMFGVVALLLAPEVGRLPPKLNAEPAPLTAILLPLAMPAPNVLAAPMPMFMPAPNAVPLLGKAPTLLVLAPVLLPLNAAFAPKLKLGVADVPKPPDFGTWSSAGNLLVLNEKSLPGVAALAPLLELPFVLALWPKTDPVLPAPAPAPNAGAAFPAPNVEPGFPVPKEKPEAPAVLLLVFIPPNPVLTRLLLGMLLLLLLLLFAEALKTFDGATTPALLLPNENAGLAPAEVSEVPANGLDAAVGTLFEGVFPPNPENNPLAFDAPELPPKLKVLAAVEAGVPFCGFVRLASETTRSSDLVLDPKLNLGTAVEVCAVSKPEVAAD